MLWSDRSHHMSRGSRISKPKLSQIDMHCERTRSVTCECVDDNGKFFFSRELDESLVSDMASQDESASNINETTMTVSSSGLINR
jgi:hypothetical protein